MTKLYLSLGSNLGDRWQHLQKAVWGLQSFMTITQISHVYETIPWGPVTDQPHFLNVCLKAETLLPPEILLPTIKQLEREQGRDQTERFGPHEIDIDLLFYGKLVTQVGSRTIPHRQIRERPFVLIPLADIAPHFIHPVHKLSIATLMAELQIDQIAGVIPLSDQLVTAVPQTIIQA